MNKILLGKNWQSMEKSLPEVMGRGTKGSG
jgi:hypothetical protein